MQHSENFVPDHVVPGSRVNEVLPPVLIQSTSMTLSRQERHFSTSSSSSSSSPTTATSSDSETRERDHRKENDPSPVPVSSFNVDDRTGTPVVCRESNHEQGRQANQKLTKNE